MNAVMPASGLEIWIVILSLGAGTYLLRLSFLGIIGGRQLPSWLLRLLRFTPVAVLPGIAAPMVLEASADSVDLIRLAAAFTTIGVGVLTRNALYAIIAGLALFFGFEAFWG